MKIENLMFNDRKWNRMFSIIVLVGLLLAACQLTAPAPRLRQHKVRPRWLTHPMLQ